MDILETARQLRDEVESQRVRCEQLQSTIDDARREMAEIEKTVALVKPGFVWRFAGIVAIAGFAVGWVAGRLV